MADTLDLLRTLPAWLRGLLPELPALCGRLWRARSVRLLLLAVPAVYTAQSLARLLRHYHRKRQVLLQFPCMPRHVLYGTSDGHNTPDEQWFENRLDRTKKFVYAYADWMGPVDGGVVLCHPDTAKEVLKYSDPKTRGYQSLRLWLGDGLLLAEGQKWQRNRRLLTPAFHFDILKPYASVYNKAADVFLQNAEEVRLRGESLPVFQTVSLMALDIILQCAFSFETNCQTASDRHPYIKGVYSISALWSTILKPLFILFPSLWLLTKNGREFKKHVKLVHAEADRVIARRRQQLEENQNLTSNRKYLDFLDILLTARDEDGRAMSPADIRAEVDTFLFEGHDTTASGISWTLYLLATHQQHQRKVQEEVDEIVRQNQAEYLEWSDIPKLKHLSLCLKESMRIYPPVPFIGRKMTRDVYVDGGKKLAAGTYVGIPIWCIHHNPAVWGPDHREFKPERFEPDQSKNRDPFAYIAFSAGPRNCIGQNFALNEEKVVIARILHRYDISIASDSPKAERYFMLVTRFAKDIKLALTPRKPIVE